MNASIARSDRVGSVKKDDVKGAVSLIALFYCPGVSNCQSRESGMPSPSITEPVDMRDLLKGSAQNESTEVELEDPRSFCLSFNR